MTPVTGIVLSGARKKSWEIDFRELETVVRIGRGSSGMRVYSLGSMIAEYGATVFLIPNMNFRGRRGLEGRVEWN